MIGRNWANSEVQSSTKPKFHVIRRTINKMKAMDQGVSMSMEEFSNREWMTMQVLQPYYKEATSGSIGDIL